MDAETFKQMQAERNEGLLKLVLQSYKAQFKMMAEGKAPARWYRRRHQDPAQRR